MKKILVIISILIFSVGIANATEQTKPDAKMVQQIINQRAQREMAFEKRLGLTEEQKIKAKEIRIKGHEKIKPVIEEIKAKKQEARMVKMSRIAVQVQEERLTKIDAELKVLQKKAHDIRKANMKEFESILTWKQKRILKEMKKEGRKNYHSTHPYKKTNLLNPNK